MIKPQIVAQDYGIHNANMDATIRRVNESGVWKKLDSILIIPAAGMVPTKVVASWLNMYAPPNNKLYRMFPLGLEVGEAYSQCIENILAHPDLSKFKYIITIEHDNVIPPDGLVKLLESMEANQQFAGISGLYHTKGENGVPQIWGDPSDPELNFRPQAPVPGKIVECCGIAQGFAAFRLDMFKDERIKRPWFRTIKDAGCATQDLAMASEARKYGYRFAVDCSILVGHYSVDDDITW